MEQRWTRHQHEKLCLAPTECSCDSYCGKKESNNELRSSPFIKINGDCHYERDRHKK